MKFPFLTLSALGVVCLQCSSVTAATALFDFEEGAFGTKWFNLSTGADLSPNWGFSSVTEALQAGNFSLGPIPHNERDEPQDDLHARSIAFELDGSGDLTFDLKGGLPSVLAPNLGMGPVSSGVQGVALRRVSNGERVLSAAARFRNTVTTITWDQATLASYAAEAEETWTLDVYDTRFGRWGWMSLDSVSVPGSVIPEPSAIVMLYLGVLGMLLRRSRS